LKRAIFFEAKKINFLKHSCLIFKTLLCSGLRTAVLNKEQQDEKLNLCRFILSATRDEPSLSSIWGKGQLTEMETFHVDN